jgi:phosphatidylinositol alpha-mannosyltransferase
MGGSAATDRNGRVNGPSTTERNTVLFVSALSFLGGAQVSLASVVDALDPAVRVALAAPDDGVLIDRVRTQDSVDELVPIPPRRDRGVLRSRIVIAAVIARWLFAHRRSLLAVHANGDAEMKLLLPLALLIRVPIVVWFHRAELPDTTTRLRLVWRLLARRVIWASVSESRRDELARVGIGTERTRVVVPNPIDPGAVVPDEPHGASEGTLVVGYLGCEYRAKGFILLPEIMEHLHGLPVSLLCVTKGLAVEGLEPGVADAMARLEAMPDQVEFQARTFDVREIYARIDAVLVPSYSESFCRVAAEGMLNGLPVVGSDLPAIRELVDAGAGLLFPTGDAPAAADRVSQLVDEPSLRTRLGAEGRRRASRFAPPVVAAQLEALYRLRLPLGTRK